MHALLEAIPRAAASFGPTLARAAHARGLAVTQQDGSTRAIPVTATPVILEPSDLKRRLWLSTHLSAATVKMAQAILASDRRELILGALSPLERKLCELTALGMKHLACTRVDYFVADRPWALEVNATIPAMQGYSDIAATTYIESVGEYAGLSASEIARLVAANGSNAEALWKALLAGYAAERGGAPRTVALLCRRNDSQLTEQRYLAEQFCAYGVEARVVHPDELSGDEAVHADGTRFDLVYRHLFIRRLEEMPSPYVEGLLAEVPGKRTVLLNPPASQVEVKATFALLSEALIDPALAALGGLTPVELEAIRESVPWTRSFKRGPSSGPDGHLVDSLVERVAAEPHRFVLKRSWDYGGRAVFVGSSIEDDAFVQRVKTTYGAPLSWRELCERAADDTTGGGYIVQERIPTSTERHLLCAGERVSEVELFVDFSAYASVGLDGNFGWGGVCRGSASQIVNILGGGGVVPLLTREVADALASALTGPTR